MDTIRGVANSESGLAGVELLDVKVLLGSFVNGRRGVDSTDESNGGGDEETDSFGEINLAIAEAAYFAQLALKLETISDDDNTGTISMLRS